MMAPGRRAGLRPGHRQPASGISALIFDKDGTLFGFQASWGAWARALIGELTGGDAVRERRLAARLRFSLDESRFCPDSPVIAGTLDEVADLMLPELAGWQPEALRARLSQSAAAAPMVEAVPLRATLGALRDRGLRLGVVTNDTEAGARSHLSAAGVTDHFDFIAGYDSGHGAKPEPGPLLAFAARLSLPPGCVAMVGDSTHDLLAAQRAGMLGIGVLTGPASREELAPFADVVLADIAAIGAWLDGRSAGPAGPGATEND